MFGERPIEAGCPSQLVSDVFGRTDYGQGRGRSDMTGSARRIVASIEALAMAGVFLVGLGARTAPAAESQSAQGV